jgi:hypothetical protein
MNIFLDKKLEDFIDDTKKKYKKGMEFEIRISDNKNKTISEEIWKNLLEKIKKKFYISPIEHTKVSIYNILQDGLNTQYREIILYDKNKEISKTCQIKTKDQNIDKIYEPNFNVRYSLSYEEDIKCPENIEKKDLIKIRSRYRQTFDSKKGYVFMFTVVPEDKFNSFEIEIEFDIEKMSVKLVEEALLNISPIFSSNIDVDNKKMILHDFNNLERYIRPPKPINIKEVNSDILNENEYQVTNKLDGERFYLYFYEDGIYAIQNDKILKISNQKYMLHSLVDTEFFKGKYYFFDCYLYEHKYTNTNLLSDRLEYAKKLADTDKSLFLIKDFSKNLLDNTIKLLETLNKDENDGLIYTPENPNKKLDIYKWKFPEKMSIDFRVNSIDQNIYELCVYTSSDQIGNTPFKINKEKAKYISKVPLQNNGIYEFLYKKNEFVLLRERKDKTKPNFLSVAINVFNDIIKPFESYKLINLFKPLRKYRRYHNKLKGDLISKFCKNKRVLDIGIGAGGDLFKYNSSKIIELYGVEPYKKNYDEFEKRLSEYDEFKDRVKLLKNSAQETEKIVNTIGLNGVDIVTSFFSLSFFFFKNTKDLKNLVQTISQNLIEDGYFIGTTIDGVKTKEFLLSCKNNTFDFGEGFIKLDSSENVIIEIKGTIVETQKESLVDFELLIKELKNVGIIFKESEFFQPNITLSESENKLNSLYRNFVFHKINITKEINELCKKNTIFNMLTRSNDENCFKLFLEYFSKTYTSIVNKPKKEYEIIDDSKYEKVLHDIDRKDIYQMMKYFELSKKEFENNKNILKIYSIFGNRIDKKIMYEDFFIYTLLGEYKNKKYYDKIKDQITSTMDILNEKKINYLESLTNLFIIEYIDDVKVVFNIFDMDIDKDNYKREKNDEKINEIFKILDIKK